MSFLHTWKRKGVEPKEQLNSHVVVNNFYGEEELGAQTRRSWFVHYTLKYKLLAPILLLFKKTMGKRLVDKPGPEPQFAPTRILSECVDKATIEWAHTYLNSLRKKNKRLTRKQWESLYEAEAKTTLKLIRTTKQVMNTIMLNDDAYNEYASFLLWTIHHRMKKEQPVRLMHSVPGGLMNAKDENWYLLLTKGLAEGIIKYDVKKMRRLR